jgi:hypothetical protein
MSLEKISEKNVAKLYLSSRPGEEMGSFLPLRWKGISPEAAS